MISDHRTNFVGVENHIGKEIQNAIMTASEKIAAITDKDVITGNFIPVATPHFGGILGSTSEIFNLNLTPGSFLVEWPINALPEADHT